VRKDDPYCRLILILCPHNLCIYLSNRIISNRIVVVVVVLCMWWHHSASILIPTLNDRRAQNTRFVFPAKRISSPDLSDPMPDGQILKFFVKIVCLSTSGDASDGRTTDRQ
jgi:hypothetical protein